MAETIAAPEVKQPPPRKKERESDLQRLTRNNSNKNWLNNFSGPILKLPITLKSPLVQHMFKRVYDITGRHAHYIQVLGPVLLPRDEGSAEALQACNDLVTNTIQNGMEHFDKSIQQLEAVIADANIKVRPTYQSPQLIEAPVLSPIQRQFLDLFLKADELVEVMDTLYLHGEMPDKDRSELQRAIKWRLRNVAASSENMFNSIRKRIDPSTQKEVTAKTGLELPPSDALPPEDADEAAPTNTSGEGKAKPSAKKPAATAAAANKPKLEVAHAAQQAAAASS